MTLTNLRRGAAALLGCRSGDIDATDDPVTATVRLFLPAATDERDRQRVEDFMRGALSPCVNGEAVVRGAPPQPELARGQVYEVDDGERGMVRITITGEPDSTGAALTSTGCHITRYGVRALGWRLVSGADETDEALRARLRAPSRVLLSGEEIALTEPLDLLEQWREVTVCGRVKADAWQRIEMAVRIERGRRPPTLTFAVPGDTSTIAGVVVLSFRADVLRNETPRGFFDVRIDLVRVAPPPRVALPTRAGLAALRAFGEAVAAVTPHAARRAIDDAIREDGRRHPAFARARMAAVMAVAETKRITDDALLSLLGDLRGYEDRRGCGRHMRSGADSEMCEGWTRGGAGWAWGMALDRYERARLEEP